MRCETLSPTRAAGPATRLARICFRLAISFSPLPLRQSRKFRSRRDYSLSQTANRYGNVCNTLFRDGRQYWVVDTNLHFQYREPAASDALLLLSEMPVALKVDSIILRTTRVTNKLPLPQAFRGKEKNWYVGLAVIDDQVIPVVNPASLLSQETLHELLAGPLTAKLQTAEGARMNVAHNSFVLFPLGAKRFALPSEQISELARPDTVHQFPSNTSGKRSSAASR